MSEDIDIYNNPDACAAIVKEINEKIDDYEDNHSTFFDEYNAAADCYRMKATNSGKKKNKGLSYPASAEITRATETLATVFYKILTAYDPNFYAVKGRTGASESDIQAITALRVFQDRKIKFKQGLMKFLRSLSLFGGGFFEEPWMRSSLKDPAWEATGFVPRSMLNVAFDRRAEDVNDGDYIASFEILSKYRLKWFIDNDELGIWNKTALSEALASLSSANNIPDRVKTRLSSANYKPESYVNNMEFCMYRGVLDYMKDYREYVVGVINRKWLVKFHPNVLPHGERGIKYVGLIQFELEPLAYGVYNLGKGLQKDITANRARIFDTITFNLFSMFKASKFAGVNMDSMQVKPWNIIEMDNIQEFEQIKTDMMGVNFGLRLEDKLTENFRSLVAATDTLQAQVTDATAREAIMAQNEGMRRVASYAELLAEPLIRERQTRAHLNNLKFLDGDIWVNVAGQEPMRIEAGRIERSAQFLPKIITDKDFAPQRSRRLIEFLQLLITSKIPLPPSVQPVIMGIIKELGRGLEIDMEAAGAEGGGNDQAMAQIQALMQAVGGGGGEQLPGVRGPQEQLSAQGVVSPSGLRSVEQ